MNVRIATEVERVPLPYYPDLFTAHITQRAYLDEHLLCSVSYEQAMYKSVKVDDKWTTVPIEGDPRLDLTDGMSLRELANELFVMGMRNGYESRKKYKLHVPGVFGEPSVSFD